MLKPISQLLTAYLLRISERSSPDVPGQTGREARGRSLEEIETAEAADRPAFLGTVAGAEKDGV